MPGDRNKVHYWRSAGLPPSFFIAQGLKDRALDEGLIRLENGALAVEANRLAVLARFRQGGPWDQQRLSGKVDSRYIDYATISIGLYAAARGIPISEILSIQDAYASMWSQFSDRVEKDSKYTHVPSRNVKNMIEGYRIFQEHDIGQAQRR